MLNLIFTTVRVGLVPGLVLLPAAWASAAGPYMRGPMIGHVSPTSAVVWVYTKNRPGARVYYRPQGSDPASARFADVDASATGSLRARTTLRGLRPDTEYVYRVFFRRRTEPAWRGGFRTPPAPGTPLKFRMAVSSCMKPDYPGHGSFDRMREEKPAFHLLLGDNVYADTTNRGKLWEAYMDMRAVPAFGMLIREVPTYAMWDDHDFAGDNKGAEVRGKHDSLEVFKEVWANPSAGLQSVYGTFFKLTWGNVDLFVLDGRFHRSRLEAPNGRHKRMLGDGQFRWLARELAASKACFKVIASGSTIRVEAEDTWTRYRFALDRIWKLIRDERIGGVIWMSGDLHRSLIDVHEKKDTGFYDLPEIVSSGIANAPERSFVTVDFDTTATDPSARVRVINGDGSIPVDRTILRSSLEMGPRFR